MSHTLSRFIGSLRRCLSLLPLPALLCVSACGCGRSSKPSNVAGAIVNPNYVAIFRLSEAQDDTHSIRVVDPDGKTWYRSEKAGLDLTMLDRSKTYLVKGDKEHPDGVGIVVHNDHDSRWLRWAQDNMGETLGIMIDGVLVRTVKLQHEPQQTLTILLESWKRCLEVAAAIRAGGVEESTGEGVSSAPASVPAKD